MMLRIPKVRMAGALFLLSLLALAQNYSAELLFRLLFIVAATFLAEFVFWKARGVEPFLPSAGLVSAFIIFLLAGPQTPFYLLLVAILAAVGLKQFLRPSGQHIFNPAASGLFLASFFGLPVTWWGIGPGLLPLLATILLAGFVSLFTIRQHRIVVPFLLTFAFLSAWYTGSLQLSINQLLVGSYWFFTLVMLPEPMTAARYPNTRLLYGITVSFLSFVAALFRLPVDPLLSSLLAGNLALRLVEEKLYR